MDDHDLLICIDVKLKELQTQFSNHLKHHFAVTIAALASAFSAIGALVVLILTE